MTPRQFAIVSLLFGAGLLAAGVARPGNREAESMPPTASKATAVAPRPAPQAAKSQPVRVILPSPYEER